MAVPKAPGNNKKNGLGKQKQSGANVQNGQAGPSRPQQNGSSNQANPPGPKPPKQKQPKKEPKAQKRKPAKRKKKHPFERRKNREILRTETPAQKQERMFRIQSMLLGQEKPVKTFMKQWFTEGQQAAQKAIENCLGRLSLSEEELENEIRNPPNSWCVWARRSSEAVARNRAGGDEEAFNREFEAQVEKKRVEREQRIRAQREDDLRRHKINLKQFQSALDRNPLAAQKWHEKKEKAEAKRERAAIREERKARAARMRLFEEEKYQLPDPEDKDDINDGEEEEEEDDEELFVNAPYASDEESEDELPVDREATDLVPGDRPGFPIEVFDEEQAARYESQARSRAERAKRREAGLPAPVPPRVPTPTPEEQAALRAERARKRQEEWDAAIEEKFEGCSKEEVERRKNELVRKMGLDEGEEMVGMVIEGRPIETVPVLMVEEEDEDVAMDVDGEDDAEEPVMRGALVEEGPGATVETPVPARRIKNEPVDAPPITPEVKPEIKLEINPEIKPEESKPTLPTSLPPKPEPTTSDPAFEPALPGIETKPLPPTDSTPSHTIKSESASTNPTTQPPPTIKPEPHIKSEPINDIFATLEAALEREAEAVRIKMEQQD